MTFTRATSPADFERINQSGVPGKAACFIASVILHMPHRDEDSHPFATGNRGVYTFNFCNKKAAKAIARGRIMSFESSSTTSHPSINAADFSNEFMILVTIDNTPHIYIFSETLKNMVPKVVEDSAAFDSSHVGGVAETWSCGNCNTMLEQRRMCTGCHMVGYCSKECQTEHWNAEGGHKAACRAIRAQRVKAFG